MDEPRWRALVGGLPDLQALTAKSLRQKAADDQLQKLGITPRLAGALTDLAMLLARVQADRGALYTLSPGGGCERLVPHATRLHM